MGGNNEFFLNFERNKYLKKLPSMQRVKMFIRRAGEVEDDEYTECYKSISKGSDEPLAKIHFTAEGEVTFKSILFVPKSSPGDMFQNYGKKMDGIKVNHAKRQIFYNTVLNISKLKN